MISSEILIADGHNAVIMSPIPPAVSEGAPTRWSRLLVGRGVDERAWPSEIRAEHFPFDEFKLPSTYPPGIFPWDDRTFVRTGHLLASAGASSSLHPWISSLGGPLRSRSADQETARRYGHLSEEDAVAVAEDLMALADSYNTSSSE